MAKTTLKASDGEGFLRAAYDATRDLEASYQVVVSTSVLWTMRRGVLQIAMAATKIAVKEDGEPAVWRYYCEYPTSQVGTLEACLFQAACRLERVIRDAHAHPAGRA